MSLKKLVLSISIFSLAITSKAEDNQYFFQQISPQYGFTHDAIRTIMEDKDGFLWFGSDDGVFYYNTLEIKKIDLRRNDSTNVPYPRILKTYKDDKDQLWVCSNSGLFKYTTALKCFSQIKLYDPELKPIHNNQIENILQVENDKYIIIRQRECFMYHEGDSILKVLSVRTDFSNRGITFITKDKDNVIFGTDRGYVFISRNSYTDPELFYASNKGDISSICRDGNKFLLGFIEDGIEVINLNGAKISEYNEEQIAQNQQIDNRVRQIIKRENGEIWIGTYQGLYILYKDNINHFDFKSGIGLPQSSIYELHKGKNGGVWVGTWAGGIAYFQDFNYQFTHVDPISLDGSKSQNPVTAFTEDNEGNVWIGSERKGMNLYKIKLNEIDKNPTPQYNFNFGNSSVRTLLHLDNGKLVIGTFDEGLLNFNPKTERVENAIKEINNNMTSAYDKNELWVGGFGFFKIEIGTGKLEKLKQALLGLNNNIRQIRFLYFDSAKNLWICTNAGLYVKYKNTNEFKQCTTSFEGESDNNTYIYTCLEDIEGNIWLGTRGKGILIYQPDIDSVNELFVNDLISNADIYSLIKDKDDALWFSSNLGIFRYVDQYNSVDHFTEYDGLSGRQFNPNAAFLCSDGKLLFGAPNGFNVINPQIIRQNFKAPEVFLANFLVNNKPLSEENSISCNSFNLGQLNKLTLKIQPTLNIVLISNNFIKSEKNKFKYRLVNFEDDWHEDPYGREIIYTKIPPGNYIFEAYGSNNDGIWSTIPYRIEITVVERLWRRWYFILLYIILFSMIVLVLITNNNIRSKLKKDIIKERYKNQASDLISAERTKFFLNISHEIRTPLSLILSPIQMLLSKFNYDIKTKELLLIVDRNAKRLLKLTNQTLDYRLLEVGKLEPHFETTDIIELAANSFQYFEQQISEKQINFSFTSEFKKIEIQVDMDMIEKIIFNLMSNAVNFTPEKGSIFLSIGKNTLDSESYKNTVFVGNEFYNESLELRITDTGIGINPSEIINYFERFSTGTDKKQSGTGIGLHLCQEYAILNNGNIMINSKEGIGSTFILNLPLKNEKYEQNKNKNRLIIAPPKAIIEENDYIYFENGATELNKRANILIVESNNEYRQYLKTFLKKYYNVITAKNVEQALEILINLQPEIIITELEFTGMDGLEFVQEIINNESYKNIPIVVLTALSDAKYNLESVKIGVDSYFTKPIDSNILLANVRNIINRSRDKNEDPSTIKKNAVKGLTMEPATFISVAEKIIETNFQNINFSSEELASQLNTSKSTLFRKIKKETDLSCTEFIREVRLKNAVNLLNNSSLNVDEIGLAVGFNSNSYFVRSFRKKYGTTPNEFRKLKK